MDNDVLKHMSSQDEILAHHASWFKYLQQFTFVIKHKARILNRVADALIRRNTIFSSFHVLIPGFLAPPELYPTDVFFGKVWNDAVACVSYDYFVLDCFLFHGSKLCLFESSLWLT